MKYLFLFLFLGSMFFSNAQTVNSMTLSQAKEYAVKNAFQVKSAEYAAQTARLQTDELIAIGLPQINGSFGYQNFIDRPTSILPGEFFGLPGQNIAVQFGVPQTMTFGLSASQLLFDGSWLIGLQASRAYAALQQKQITKSEIDVKRATEEAYQLAVIAKESLVLLKSSREVLNNSLNHTTALNKEGFVEEQDVQQLTLSLNELDNRIRSTELQSKIALDLLKFSIGMPMEETIDVVENSQQLLDQFNAQLLQQPFNSDDLIDNQIVRDGIALQKMNLKNYQAKKLPNLVAFYNWQRQAQRQQFNFFDTDEDWYPTQIWGLSMNIPILSGGSKNKAIQRIGVEVKKLEETLTYSSNAAKLSYNSALTEYTIATQNLEQAKSSYSLAQDILQKTEIKFEIGTVSSFELSRQTSQLLQSQGNLVQARLALLNAQTKLSQSLNAL
ncbi:MAG: TolC family protein [Bacteroidota bacterium]